MSDNTKAILVIIGLIAFAIINAAITMNCPVILCWEMCIMVTIMYIPVLIGIVYLITVLISKALK